MAFTQVASLIYIEGSFELLTHPHTYAEPLVSDSFTPLVPFFRFVYRTIFQGELRVKQQGSAAGGKANYTI